MGISPEIETIVSQLESKELKKLASRGAMFLEENLLGIISNIWEIKMGDKPDKYGMVPRLIHLYEARKAEMQGYKGIWKDRYEQVFLKVKDGGDLDVNLFYGIEEK